MLLAALVCVLAPPAGSARAANARVALAAFTITDGADHLRAWQPEGGQAKY